MPSGEEVGVYAKPLEVAAAKTTVVIARDSLITRNSICCLRLLVVLHVSMGGVDYGFFCLNIQLFAVVKIKTFEQVKSHAFYLGLNKRVCVVSCEIAVYELSGFFRAYFPIIVGPLAQRSDATASVSSDVFAIFVGARNAGGKHHIFIVFFMGSIHALW
ncbi:hypothetical protein ALQ08_104386 [Pseudomonas syringae pv. delphinii]|uniref:Uncharacterized protein n=1 Tax=Pseudomonas syringae pv. delphinii TaxID=192088 RepID=A0A0N8RDT6_9PSED|nr:hypothetical protein ALO72_103596 [Pseudomonas syringae pv. delphinii]RMP23604.1 hypothetical protein ALQ27_104458 [Pseudomonas syringae pv. delphinii]RMQ16059.1 hypothetical protein ALQ08_104386 [Pseudomonas syringae pv. delphinii]